jgi:osmotically-inducible protein OsmY
MDYNVVSDPKDVEIEALLNRKLRSRGNNIRVVVDAEHVSLFGSVDDFETKRIINLEARGIAGFRKLNSFIRVTR